MRLLMLMSHKSAAEPNKTCGDQNKTAKKGVCWLELRRSGMAQWGTSRKVAYMDQDRENIPQNLSTTVKEELETDEMVTIGSLVSPNSRKRKHSSITQINEARAVRHANQSQTSMKNSNKHVPPKKENSISRWSTERYKLALKSMLEVMKAEGAVYESPISRPVLRTAARKYIGDTGLLDHLLKHVDGKVAPGGTERFRRCFNTEGVMEYWLESADLVKIKREAGIPDPNWVPPSWWKTGDVGDVHSVCNGELTAIKNEIEDLKRAVKELASNIEGHEQANPVQEMQKEFIKLEGNFDQQLMEVSSSMSCMQEMLKELLAWRSKIEQQVKEISNSLSCVQASNQTGTLIPASETFGQEIYMEFVIWKSKIEQQLKEMSNPQNCMQALKQHASSSPASETLGQEMSGELATWKSKIEQQLRELSNSLSCAQALKQHATFFPASETFGQINREFATLKSKIEQQLKEISNSLSCMQASKQPTTFSPASETERWEDWLESTNLDNIQGEDFAPWLESTDLVNIGSDASVRETYSAPQPWLKSCSNPSQDSACARELDLLKEELANVKRNMQELVLHKRREEDQANVTPDSSVTINSNLDFENSSLLFQEMVKELVAWKGKMEDNMLEMSNSLRALMASKRDTI